MNNFIQTMSLLLALSGMFYIGYKTAKNNTLRQKKYTLKTSNGKKEIETKKLLDYSSDYKNFPINWEKNSGLLFSETLGLICIENEIDLEKFQHYIHTNDAKFFIFDKKNAYEVVWNKRGKTFSFYLFFFTLKNYFQ